MKRRKDEAVQRGSKLKHTETLTAAVFRGWRGTSASQSTMSIPNIQHVRIKINGCQVWKKLDNEVMTAKTVTVVKFKWKRTLLYLNQLLGYYKNYFELSQRSLMTKGRWMIILGHWWLKNVESLIMKNVIKAWQFQPEPLGWPRSICRQLTSLKSRDKVSGPVQQIKSL